MSNSELYQQFRSQFNGLGLTQKEISSRWHEFKLANNLTRKRSPRSINSPRRSLQGLQDLQGPESTYDGMSTSEYEGPGIKQTSINTMEIRGNGKIKGTGFIKGYFEGIFNGEFDGIFNGILEGEVITSGFIQHSSP